MRSETPVQLSGPASHLSAQAMVDADRLAWSEPKEN